MLADVHDNVPCVERCRLSFHMTMSHWDNEQACTSCEQISCRDTMWTYLLCHGLRVRGAWKPASLNDVKESRFDAGWLHIQSPRFVGPSCAVRLLWGARSGKTMLLARKNFDPAIVRARVLTGNRVTPAEKGVSACIGGSTSFKDKPVLGTRPRGLQNEISLAWTSPPPEHAHARIHRKQNKHVKVYPDTSLRVTKTSNVDFVSGAGGGSRS